MDVHENIDCITDRNGSIIFNEIRGEVNMRTKLSGMPECQLTFINPRLLDDVSFHPVCRPLHECPSSLPHATLWLSHHITRHCCIAGTEYIYCMLTMFLGCSACDLRTGPTATRSRLFLPTATSTSPSLSPTALLPSSFASLVSSPLSLLGVTHAPSASLGIVHTAENGSCRLVSMMNCCAASAPVLGVEHVLCASADGACGRCRYILGPENQITVPIQIRPSIVFNDTGGKLDIEISPRSAGAKPIEDVVITISLPKQVGDLAISVHVAMEEFVS